MVHRLDDPFDFFYLNADFNYVDNYKTLFYLAIVISMIFIRNSHVRLFSAIGFTIFCTNLILRKGQYIFDDEDFFIFESLARNDKWIYFFSFLIVMSSYPELLRLSEKVKIKRASIIVNIIFIIILSVVFRVALSDTVRRSYIPMKILKKTGICSRPNSIDGFIGPSLFCTNQKYLNVVDINNDTNGAVDVMIDMPAELTFTGPAWLRYKADRNLKFNMSDGYDFLVVRDRDYFEWKKQYQVWRNVFGTCLPENPVAQCLDDMKKIGSDFFFLEKFQHSFGDVTKLYSFERKEYDLTDVPLVYENRSFAIIDLREKPAGAPRES